MFNIFKKAAQFSVSFLTLQFILLLALLMVFFFRVPTPANALEWFYLLSLPSYYYVLIALFIVLLSPLTLSSKTQAILFIPAVILQSYIMADIYIFDIYHFHINQMLLDMFIFDLAGIGVPSRFFIIASIVVIMLLFINYFIFKQTQKKTLKIFYVLLPIAFIVFVLNQLVHVWASGFYQSGITKYSLLMPVYYPITSSKTVEKIKHNLPTLIPEEQYQDKHKQWKDQNETNKGNLIYPKTDLFCRPKYKILMIVLESWRSDMLKKEVMPNLYALAQKSTRFSNHLSGGNVTISGLFSLLYGLHPSYLSHVRAAPHKYQQVLHEVLQNLNYKTEVYTSSNLSRFSMRSMFFGHVEEKNYHYLRSFRGDEVNDRLVTDALVENILADNIKDDWYRFVFLTSSHHAYNYPPEHTLFKPVGNDGGFVFNKFINALPYLNDYKNSLHYEDALLFEILQALKKSAQFDDTVIVITGDHGEAFNDNNKGYWGHGSNYTRMQTGVPLIVHMPGQTQGRVITQRSAHIDISPSLLKHGLNCEGDFSGISNGEDLFNLPAQRSIISRSYFNRAYIINDFVYVEELGIKSYSLDDLSDDGKRVPYAKIRHLMEETQYFLKQD